MPAASVRSVRTATELGVDWLMGGTWIEETLRLLRGTSIGYADPLDLVRAATTGRLVVAGSITDTDQIQALATAGVDAFTIGSAAFGGSLQPHAGTLRSQLAPVVVLWHRRGEVGSRPLPPAS
ncbi:hypothetical protein ABTX60_28570 [Streptomyces sp. NPDC126510]|uniref:hypothetical protein n=1 Tax=Streptomyces sp. NPDC126510 TaxID=3155317 RepID=UPI00332F6374